MSPLPGVTKKNTRKHEEYLSNKTGWRILDTINSLLDALVDHNHMWPKAQRRMYVGTCRLVRNIMDKGGEKGGDK
jgi:hypothetical protein